MSEFGRITSYLKDVVGKDANVIWGTGHDENLLDEISVTIIATGFESYPGLYEKEEKEKEVIRLKFGDTLEKVIDEDTFEAVMQKEQANQSEQDNEIIDEDESSIELELDFDKNYPKHEDDDEENEITPDNNPSHFNHVKDLDRLNDSFYLDELEDQPAIMRKKHNNEDN